MLKQEMVKVARDQRTRKKLLTREEESNWEERNVGLNLSEMIERLNFGRPASPEFIAGLRLEQEEDRKFVDAETASLEIACSICQSNLEEGEAFMVSPCDGGHQFHEDCFLEQLRNKNECPNCREKFPVAPSPPWEGTAIRFWHFVGMGWRPHN